jgi:hypothetical protein
MIKKDLVLADFAESLVPRIDKYRRRLEEANPGVRFTRTDCVQALLVRALAEIEGQEVWERRSKGIRSESTPSTDRRQDYRRMRDRAIVHVEKEIESLLQVEL